MSIKNRINSFRENLFSANALLIFIIIFPVYSGIVYFLATKVMHTSNHDWRALLATAFVGSISFTSIISLADRYSVKNFYFPDILFVCYIAIGGGGVAIGVGVGVLVTGLVSGVFGVVVGVVFSVGVIAFCLGDADVGDGDVGGVGDGLRSLIAFAMATATAYGTGLISNL